MKKMVLKPQTSKDNTISIPNDEQPKLGQWFWVTSTCRWNGDVKGLKEGDTYEWFGCVMKTGVCEK